MRMKFCLIAILVFFTLYGCKEKAINIKEVLSDLQEYYYANKVGFDSLAAKLADTTIGNSEISFIINRMKIKKSMKGYEKPRFKEWGISPEDRSFSVKELGYGIDCGFFYLRHEQKDYFKNTRLVYKRIIENWYSYIYFN